MIPALANIALVLLGAIRVESGDLTVGEFSSVIFLFTLLVLPLRLIGYALSELPRSMAAWDRIQAVVNEPVEADPDSAIGRPAHGIGVHLDAVQFRHESSSDRTLVDIDLELAAGTITALVGPDRLGQVDAGRPGARPHRTDGRNRVPRPRSTGDRVPGSVPRRWDRA